MSDELRLFCWILGVSNRPLGVKITKTERVNDLANAIMRAKPSAFKSVEMDELLLWQVLISESSIQEEIGVFKSNDKELLPTSAELSTIFVHTPSRHVHVVVQISPISTIGPSSSDGEHLTIVPRKRAVPVDAEDKCEIKKQHKAEAPIPLAPRSMTVSGLYRKLQEKKFVQVRGNPASGKTSLANLLTRHIRELEPDTSVVGVIGWPKENEMHPQGYVMWLRSEGWTFQKNGVLIVDEAQGSYWDNHFWSDNKAIDHSFPYRIVTLASYGSSGTNESIITPGIGADRTVDLQRVQLDDNTSLGLLTKEEFDECVTVKFADHRFDVSLLDAIFEFTNGHVGSCVDLLTFTLSHNSYHALQGTFNTTFTLSTFLTSIPMTYLVRLVGEGAGASHRGLPSRASLQDPEISDTFIRVLRDGRVSLPDSGTVNEGFQKCIERGWLHHAPSDPIDPRSHYVFASTWHKRYVECLLFGNESQVNENSLIDFATQIIMKFSPINLIKRDIGNISQSIPEAQFQDEFYHAGLVHTRGGVLSFPEFGNKHGRIDFFIPSKKWGIELLHNGDRIAAHAERCTQGEYQAWISSGILADYLIIDFRTVVPRNERNINNLYYVVSTDGWKTVKILNNKNVVVHEAFQLLHAMNTHKDTGHILMPPNLTSSV